MKKPCLDHGYSGNSDGYASVRRPTGRDPKVLLHRWIFLDIHGFLPEVVMHTCDNPRCVEPSHLVAGTRLKNNRDRADKGRSAKARPDKRKLRQEQVDEIRSRYAKRLVPRDSKNGPFALSKEFGVDTNVIYQIVRWQTYR